MRHRIYRVESFEIVAPYTLLVKFDGKTQQTIDFQPVLAKKHRRHKRWKYQ